MSSTTGTEIAATSTAPETKQGHVCCFFCCDMRRAVVIVNILNIFNVLFWLLIMMGFDSIIKQTEEEQYQEFLQIEKSLAGLLVFSVIGWILSFGAIYGAFKYKIVPVALQALFTAIYFLGSNILLHKAAQSHAQLSHSWYNWLFSLVINLLFVYPHLMLLTELRSGIMTPETYSSREKASCCCV